MWQDTKLTKTICKRVFQICSALIFQRPTASRLQWVKFRKVISTLSLLFAYMYRIVYPTITFISILLAYLHDLYNCEFQVWRFRGFIQVLSPLFSCSSWGNSERYLSYLYLEMYLLRYLFYIVFTQQDWYATNVACVLQRILLKSIAVLCIISWRR